MAILSQHFKNRFSILLSFVLVLANVVVGLAAPLEHPPAQEPPPAIHVAGHSFRPAGVETAALPPGLQVAANAQNQNGYYIVQFSGPILESWRAGLEGTGAQAVAYLPDFAYKVRMNPGQARQVERLPNVIWVGPFQPGFKLSPDLKQEDENIFRIRVERGGDFGLTRAAIAATGAELLGGDGNVLVVAASRDQVTAIAHVSDVAWVENFQLRERHNEYGGGVIMGANVANALHPNGHSYDGSTQIVAVADTGIGGGSAATAHAGIPAGRVQAIFDWPTQSSKRCYTAYPDGARDVDSGHGTHVATSVLGAGDGSGVGRGTAPAARLVFQAVEDFVDMIGQCALLYADGYYLTGLPNDIRQLFQQAYTAGARIHSNSWGSDAAGDYTADSANADDFMWTNRDMLITFSAGNAGIDANANGVVDADSTGSPATAKNVLTVGASENARPNYPCDAALSGLNGCTGQNTPFTYGAAWPADYPANPLASDPSAGNQEQMAAFSSRGPTDDNRIKPDVVAPGTWILSGYSDLFQQGYDAGPNTQNGAWQYDGWGNPLNAQYKWMGGTSMSNPLTAGGAAVVRDYYKKVHNRDASAALVKATLINSAVDMADEDNDPGTANIGIPNIHEGWGRVNLAAATDGRAFVENSAGIGTGGSAAYNFTASGGPVKISLVWTDFPSTETASINLVNDLDLTVTGPGGTYRGNVFANGSSQTGGTRDSRNNVENVYIASATNGASVSVQVSGFNVAFGPQPFALVVSGATPSSPPPNTPPTAGFSYNCTHLSCTFTDASSDSDGSVVSRAWNFGDGNTSSALNPSHTYAAAGTYNVSLTVTDNGGATGSTSQNVTVTAPSGGISLSASGFKVKGLQKADLTWSGATGVVHIYRDNVLIAQNVGGNTYRDNIDAKGSGTYVYRVCLSSNLTVCSNNATVVF